MNLKEAREQIFKKNPWYIELYYEIVYRIPDKISRAFWNVVAFFERGKNGYSVQDTWDLDNYLARVLSKSIKEMSKDMYGHPFGISYRKWKAGLRQASNAFRDYYELDSLNLPPKEEVKRYLIIRKRIKKALSFLAKYWENLWN